MPTDRQKDRWTDRQMTDRQKDRQTFQLSYQNKSILECQQDVKASVRKSAGQTDRVTERQNDSMADDSRAAKEPALVYF